MSVNSSQSKHWTWPAFALGFLLLLPSILLYVTSPRDRTFVLPKPGSTSEIDVVNRGYRALLGDDDFKLFYEVGVAPDSTAYLPERPPILCSFQLLNAQSGETIAALKQLHHAYDVRAEHKAGFASESFKLPNGKTRLRLTNLGCNDGSSVRGGVGRIYWFIDSSLVPIGASILGFFGLASIAIELVIGLVGYLRSKVRTRRELASY